MFNESRWSTKILRQSQRIKSGQGKNKKQEKREGEEPEEGQKQGRGEQEAGELDTARQGKEAEARERNTKTRRTNQ